MNTFFLPAPPEITCELPQEEKGCILSLINANRIRQEGGGSKVVLPTLRAKFRAELEAKVIAKDRSINFISCLCTINRMLRETYPLGIQDAEVQHAIKRSLRRYTKLPKRGKRPAYQGVETRIRKSNVKRIGALRISRVIVTHILKAMRHREKAVSSFKAPVHRSDTPWKMFEKHVGYTIARDDIHPDDVIDGDEVCQWFGRDPNQGRRNRTIQKIGEPAVVNGLASDRRTFTTNLMTTASGKWKVPTFLFKDKDAGLETHRMKPRAFPKQKPRPKLRPRPRQTRLDKLRNHVSSEVGGGANMIQQSCHSTSCDSTRVV